MIQPSRIQPLNRRSVQDGRYVLYWMQASQRVECNHALEYAVGEANGRNLPVVVAFGLTDRFPEANLRHYVFMLEGLEEVREGLQRRGIRFVLQHRSPELAATALAEDAALVVTDRGYLRIQRQWRRHVAANAPCAVVQVESDVVVPAETASPKEEYTAGTLRPKLQRILKGYLIPLHERPVRKDSLALRLDVDAVKDAAALARTMPIDRSVPPSAAFRGGTSRANALLEDFIAAKLRHYADRRSDPGLDYSSHLSPYLHFGQISPLAVALRVWGEKSAPAAAREAFLEELIVRRELGVNFALYNERYDEYGSLPGWAKKTLADHAKDRRDALYDEGQWERAETHDGYWNAAQREMVLTGKMHNYMRMYWGKKILEWSRTPQEAFRTALRLNNRYELDGRDPNSYAGVAWCFGKHDRAWPERRVFGKIRYMNEAGLRRKFDMPAYLEKVAALERGR
ncbi:MAG TPA: deoxyribodipyrimidine photo-lyase [Syntrophales bacterium]|nr:deoxyribodipyrimidine photo-lyase [Syntrophobacterales bacterium]HQL90904.1 deoxyribodipyrimidine photo-lyase [Syntrophales bacterium]